MSYNFIIIFKFIFSVIRRGNRLAVSELLSHKVLSILWRCLLLRGYLSPFSVPFFSSSSCLQSREPSASNDQFVCVCIWFTKCMLFSPEISEHLLLLLLSPWIKLNSNWKDKHWSSHFLRSRATEQQWKRGWTILQSFPFSFLGTQIAKDVNRCVLFLYGRERSWREGESAPTNLVKRTGLGGTRSKKIFCFPTLLFR